jgi:hypothetical protein
MAAPIHSPAKCEVRSVIWFLNIKGECPEEIHKKKIVALYGDVYVVAIPTAIFTKFTNAPRHSEQISYIEFHKNRDTIAESTYKSTFAPLRKVLLSLSRFLRS